jgi:hypothetical protein
MKIEVCFFVVLLWKVVARSNGWVLINYLSTYDLYGSCCQLASKKYFIAVG